MAATQAPEVFPENLLNDESFTREEQARALAKAFFQIADEWGLSADEARTLLGKPGKSRFYDLKKGHPRAVHHLCDDELDRLAYLTGIYYGLGILFTPENTQRWLHNRAASVDGQRRPWGEQAPLAHLLSGKMEALIDVYRYVNGLRGGM